MALSRRQITQTLLLTASGTALGILPKRPAQSQGLITVTTAQELVAAIGPNRTVELAAGVFTLSEIDPTWQSPYARFQSVFDGYELVISNIENLTLVGTDNTLSRLLTVPRYADVLKFQNCRNLSFQNLEIAHTHEAGFCRGSVLSFANCARVDIDRCVLLDSGTHGIEAHTLSTLNCRASVIRECTYGIVCLHQATAVRFEGCQFFENTCYSSMIGLANCQGVRFEDCLIYDNDNESFDLRGDNFLVNPWQSEDVALLNCQVRDNRVPYLAPIPEAIALINTTLEDNTFDRTQRYPTDQYQSMPFCPLD